MGKTVSQEELAWAFTVADRGRIERWCRAANISQLFISDRLPLSGKGWVRYAETNGRIPGQRAMRVQLTLIEGTEISGGPVGLWRRAGWDAEPGQIWEGDEAALRATGGGLHLLMRSASQELLTVMLAAEHE